MKLTKGEISALKPSEKDYVRWDPSLQCFGVRVKRSGMKTFILQYRNKHGRSRRMSIAPIGDLTLDQARKEAKRLKGLVALGHDPAEEKLKALSGDTIRDLSDRYMQDHCEGRCKESTIAAHQWLLDKFILPKFGTYRINELSSSDISTFHQSMKGTPYNANRVLGLIKAMLNKAEQWGLLDETGSPARVIKPFRERKRQRFLTANELQELHETLMDMERLKIIGTYQAAAIRLLVLTGCRLNEILTLRWETVDLANRRLLLEHHKTDRKGAKAIPLNGPAVDLLEHLPRVKGNPYVIVGNKQDRHLVNLQKPWKRVREEAGLKDVRIHDLRHSFASAAASAGIPLQIIGGLLGHSSPQTTARYAHLAQDPVDQASEVVGQLIHMEGK